MQSAFIALLVVGVLTFRKCYKILHSDSKNSSDSLTMNVTSNDDHASTTFTSHYRHEDPIYESILDDYDYANRGIGTQIPRNNSISIKMSVSPNEAYGVKHSLARPDPPEKSSGAVG